MFLLVYWLVIHENNYMRSSEKDFSNNKMSWKHMIVGKEEGEGKGKFFI